MSLQDAFDAAAEPKPRTTKLDAIRSQLSREDALALDMALRGGLTHTDIARVLRSKGFAVSDTTVRRERERYNTKLNGL
jgi:hypothetical protein